MFSLACSPYNSCALFVVCHCCLFSSKLSNVVSFVIFSYLGPPYILTVIVMDTVVLASGVMSFLFVVVVHCITCTSKVLIGIVKSIIIDIIDDITLLGI